MPRESVRGISNALWQPRKDFWERTLSFIGQLIGYVQSRPFVHTVNKSEEKAAVAAAQDTSLVLVGDTCMELQDLGWKKLDNH